MTALSTRASSPSLSELYVECIQSFGEYLLVLSEKDCRVIRLGQVHLPEILEEYGRTKVWGDQTKADLPARARGSLDDTLRHDAELKYLVQAILMRLKALLSQATYIARRKHEPVLGSDHDSISSVSADSDSDSNDDGEHQRYRMPRIRLLVRQTLEQIRSLYDLSALLRRPKIADKYIRSVKSKCHTATLIDPDYLPLSVEFSRFDESHVVEKVLQWRGLTKSGECIDVKIETVAPMGQGSTKDCVDDILWFCQRLAGANTRRREQFQYWTDHPYDPKEDSTNAARLASPNLAQVHAKQVEEKLESQNQASTFKPSIPNVPREGPKSAVSKQSFSTAAVSDIHDTKTNVRPRTVYAPTAIGQGRSNSVPDPPKTEIGTTFPCPYCGTTLESSEMQNRQSWKRHVFRDLRPYVCTFEDCQNGGKLYVSRHDWIYHELQMHRRNYVCKVCQKTCSSRKEMSTHLREHYDDSISPSQLDVILDLCNHQVDVLDYEKDSCLVCGEELSLSVLQGHLAAHMEDIALFVLPNTSEEEETGGSKASVQAAKLKSKGKISGTESEPFSLGFSAAGDYRQTPTGFSKLLTSEEAGYTSKILSWRKADEDQESASTKALVAQLEDPDGYVRRAAVQTLGRESTLPDGILQAVAARLEDLNGNVRSAAVEALACQPALPYGILQAVAAQLGDKALETDQKPTLDTIHKLGILYVNHGKLDQAEQMYIRALEGYEKVLGPEQISAHISTLGIVNNLGTLFRDQGKLRDAEMMYKRALEGYEKVLGTEHTLTLDVVNNLGTLFRDQGKLLEAEVMYIRALEGYKKVLGPEQISTHTSTLGIVNNLGTLFRDQGKLRDAEVMYKRALEGYEKVLGPERTLTLNVVNNLGALFRDQGKLREAEVMYIRAVEGYEKVLGPEHTLTLDVVNNLGTLFRDQGKLREAERMSVRARAGR